MPNEPYAARFETACGRGGPVRGREAHVPRWPYVQRVTATGADVLFTTTLEGEFRVRVYTPEGRALGDVPAAVDETAPSEGRQYLARLAGLPPATTICYAVSVNGQPLTAPTGFRSAPDPKSPSTVRFAAMGDLGERSSDQFAVLERLERVPLDLLLLTGDIAYEDGTPEEFERNFFGVYRELLGRIPVFPASGNHDYYTADAQPFRDAFALFENGGPEGRERWYSFDWGPVHFVVLDTEKINDVQATWLDADLRAHDRPWTVAIAHRPPYSSGSHGSDSEVRAVFSPILEKHRVPLALLGHDHHYERTKPIHGVVYVVTGGGGRGTRPVSGADFTAVSDQVAHFVWVEADVRTLRLVAIDGTGNAFDSLLLERTPR